MELLQCCELFLAWFGFGFFTWCELFYGWNGDWFYLYSFPHEASESERGNWKLANNKILRGTFNKSYFSQCIIYNYNTFIKYIK